MKILKKICFGLFTLALILSIGQLENRAHASFTPPVTSATTPAWVKYTVHYTDFGNPSPTQTIQLVSLPKQTIVTGVALDPTVRFTGGIISAYTLSVGLTSNIDLMTPQSVFTTATRPFTSTSSVAVKQSAPENVTVTAIATTGVVGTATNGTANIWLLESTIQ